MAQSRDLSDEALAVFAFAAYHQLSSGQDVLSVVRRDGAGHQASDSAVAELTDVGLIEADDKEIRFTDKGQRLLKTMLSGLRGNPST